jgi:hypothetical protein
MQVPAPFVVLCRQLNMAVSYEATSFNPSHASVADRQATPSLRCPTTPLVPPKSTDMTLV